MEAAPPAPARPDPTMMTVYLRLLAGLTSFISKRCLSHFFSRGPEGALASSFTAWVLLRSPDDPGQDGQGERNVAEHHDGRVDPRSRLRRRDRAGVRDAESLEHAPHAVPQMQPQQHH